MILLSFSLHIGVTYTREIMYQALTASFRHSFILCYLTHVQLAALMLPLLHICREPLSPMVAHLGTDFPLARVGSDNAGILVAEAYPSVVGPVSHWNVGKAAEGAASFLFFFFAHLLHTFVNMLLKGYRENPLKSYCANFGD